MKCERCNSIVPAIRVRGHTKFCSKKCQKANYRELLGLNYSSLPTGTVGTIGELAVGLDLLSKGFEVFRSMTPNCSCDLVILRNGKLFRVEVRTGYRNKMTGKVMRVRKDEERPRHDIFAVVLELGREVVYDPPLETLD